MTDRGRWPEWPGGDGFVVYPDRGGPVDSVRWEVFAQGLQDYAPLHAAGIATDDPLLRDIRDFAEFLCYSQWINQHRQQALRVLDASQA